MPSRAARVLLALAAAVTVHAGDWSRFLGSLMETTYRGPVCIEVEDDTFGKSLEGRQRALKVAGNVLRPFFA